MNLRIGFASACCAVLVAAGLSSAHHSFSAGFDLSKKFTVTGTLTKMDWRNPHVELVVEAKGEQGQVETWTVETMPPSFFRNRDVTKSDFENAIGKTLTIEGVPSLTGRRTDGCSPSARAVSCSRCRSMASEKRSSWRARSSA